MSTVLSEDMKRISSERYIDWDKIEDSDFLITGATGLVGSVAAKIISYVKMKHGSKGKIYLLARDESKVYNVFGNNIKSNCMIPVYGDVRSVDLSEIHADYVIHAASVTASKTMVSNPVETLMTSIIGTENILSFSSKQNVKGVVYLSSMEMYGYTEIEQNPVSEEKLGYVDLRNVRSCYPEGKRACECLCVAYAKEYGVPVRIARLAQTFGVGVSETDNRVFASFAKSAMREEPIILHTKGMSVGNYCYTSDVVGALLCLLTKGESGEAYNVVNEANSMRIHEMAELVAKDVSHGKSEVIYDIPEDILQYGYAADTNLRLSSEKLRKLGWHSEIDLAEMYRRMIRDWEQ